MTEQLTAPGVPPEADRFDFSPLKTYAPKGLNVVIADDEYLMVTRVTAARTFCFIVFKSDGAFHLHGSNRALSNFSRATCDDSNHILSKPELQPLLATLGWGRR